MTTPTVFRRNLRAPQPTAVRAAGMHVWDSTGKRYLDGVGGVAVNIIGHAVPQITEDIVRLREQLSFTYGAVFANPWQDELAARLVDLSPFAAGSVYFASGGSEANEIAIKLARQYHLERGDSTRWKVLSRAQAYHGNTLATSAISGRPSWQRGFDPYFMPASRASAPNLYRLPPGIDDEAALAFWTDEFRRLIIQEGADTVSAFIAEPIIGSSLVGVVPPPGYYEMIRALCDEHGILFIADEVLAGYGRTGARFSIDHWGVLPDIITAGKGIGSGYAPIAACILSSAVADTIADGSGTHTQGFTFSGTAFVSHIGVKVNDYVMENGLIERSALMGDYLHMRLTDLHHSIDAVGEVRGRGLLGGIEFVADRSTKAPFAPELAIASKIVDHCAERGVMLMAGPPGSVPGQGGDLIQISPAYVITETQIDEIIDVLGEAIRAVVPQ